MPSKTKKQHDFMQAVAHGMKPRAGHPSKEVAEEFVKKDSFNQAFKKIQKGQRRASPPGDK